ncbi:uncharacterized protein AC631_05348 [Debaryomyces fabryi]|uniref:N(6)-L-threonylcarbamoyladenine synthase n=1 Tax=Debaryomyces fabryi TaxID=58627 RepID=A0A0V1PRQ4_9ASCO|nr:uncharacterized protein AC631_05348 [Debaryomyces fabryi]KRZ98896.1 hypothetical protein AC631_05348 [Debaryomyces fabryi]CUM54558.1 unnamed protein product [Debaryomyces fabryi]
MIRSRLLKRNLPKRIGRVNGGRPYMVLALESSCDDACVALLDKYSKDQPPKVIDQFKETLNSSGTGGIIPTDAHEFHQFTVANLVSRFCKKHNLNSSSPPDLICCTRGPGMVGSLSASLQFAKGLAMSWNKPLIGVHHMLGHILIANLPKNQQPEMGAPKYPFLSLLCSGGHTMLVFLKSLTEHEIIINTVDIAAGDSIDKCARELGLVGNMLGKELEKYVNSIPEALKERFENINTNSRDNEFSFQLSLPLRSPKHLKIPENLEFSFASFLSTIQGYRTKYFKSKDFDEVTNMFIAFKLQELVFDHIINRINIAFIKHGIDKESYAKADGKFKGVEDFICSGGVAANEKLRNKLYNNLNYSNLTNTSDHVLNFHFPDLALCTDNAIMIGVAGIEIFEKLKVKSDLSILPIRKWPMNELLKVDGWVELNGEEVETIRNLDL